MPNRPPSAAAPRNRFLDRLPEPTRGKLLPRLQSVELKSGRVLYEDHGPIEHVYFPAGSALSALTVMQDGTIVGVATVGIEGLVGHYGPGGETSPHRVIVQTAGGAYRIALRALRGLAEGDGPLKERLAAHQAAFLAQMQQSAACNGLHGLEQRCCRWLLMVRDGVGSDDLRLTHEPLDAMLAALPESVEDALRPLLDEGLVRSHRGFLSILDGAGLEARSCECYFVVRDRYAALLDGESEGAGDPEAA